MAAMTRNLPTARVAAPLPPVAPLALSPADIKRKMDEIQQRMKTTLPAAVADPAKRGLKMDVHPLFDKAGAVDVDSIKSMFAKPNFSTTKANQRVTPAATKEAAAVAARLAQKAIEKKKAEEDAANPDSAAAAAAAVPEKPKILELVEPSPDLFDPLKNPYFDPKISKAMPKHRVAGKAFRFVQKGKFVDMANKIRQEAMLEKLKADIAANAKKSGMAVELDLVSDLCVRREPPPAAEWWDATFLGQDTAYEQFSLDAPHLDNILTDLIQHPVPIQPPADLGAPAPRPLMLTKKETKKLRRQRRLEAQKEKREKISIGLIPADQPKVKISNLMRVLGTEAVQDPTKIEAAVRQQMRARQLKHDKYIAEHKLTKEQKRERMRLKLLDNTHIIVEACVFKVSDLRRPQHRFKVDVNANQLCLSGAVLLHPGSNLVIVEGGNRGIKQYKKLMMRRIDWTEGAGEGADDEENSTAGRSVEDNGKPNECILVWEGKIKRRLFAGFNVIQCPTERSVKDALEKVGAVHYWDAAKHYAVETL
ncbi:pre-mRNA processing factor 3-domain-containing protein [Obelidium mucronatum]|nr:pre-mRNA processing factor 3-domain-containing protein [Obelidium mucronatum]